MTETVVCVMVLHTQGGVGPGISGVLQADHVLASLKDGCVMETTTAAITAMRTEKHAKPTVSCTLYFILH